MKLPAAHEQQPARKVYDQLHNPIVTPAELVRHVIDCASAGRHILIFSGGPAVSNKQNCLMRSAHAGGGFGSIIGRNSFQRPKKDALRLLGAIMDIYSDAPVCGQFVALTSRSCSSLASVAKLSEKQP